MLEIQNVSKTFNAGTVNEKTALNGLNLKLNEGDFVTVIGGNGAGKSTMLNAVAGVWPVDCGKIIIDGVDVTRLSEHQRAAYIGRVFQDPMTGTAATMQIEENLALAARRGKPRTLRIGITRAEREQYRELLKSLDLGLENRLTARVGLLSGGQRQALTLLMATMNKPKLLLLDEPLSNLDAKLRLSMRVEIKRLQKKLGITTLFVTHDQEECFSISDKVAVMNNGVIEQFDTPENIYRRPATEFVARFIGFENFLEMERDGVHVYRVPDGSRFEVDMDCEEEAFAGTIRPDDICLAEQGQQENVLTGAVGVRTFLGKSYQYEVNTAAGVLKVNMDTSNLFREGQEIRLYLPKDKLVLVRR